VAAHWIPSYLVTCIQRTVRSIVWEHTQASWSVQGKVDCSLSSGPASCELIPLTITADDAIWSNCRQAASRECGLEPGLETSVGQAWNALSFRALALAASITPAAFYVDITAARSQQLHVISLFVIYTFHSH
jgi:hypothetical protein